MLTILKAIKRAIKLGSMLVLVPSGISIERQTVGILLGVKEISGA